MRRRSAVLRRACMALVVAILAVAVPAAAHGPPIAGHLGVHDDLALVQRDWRVDEVETKVYDLSGVPLEAGAPDVAFRVHADAMLAEGALTLPDPGRTAPPPVYNIGVRFLDVRIEPPLALEGGARLARVLLGPLDWSPAVREEAFGRLALTTTADVPWPDDDGVSPSAEGNVTTATGVRLSAVFAVVARPDADDLDDPDALHERAFASPAELRLDLALDTGARALPDGTVVTLTTLFDFVHPTDARRVDVGDWTGIQLERDGRFAALFALGHDQPVVARNGTRLGADPVRLVAPLAFNVTGAGEDPAAIRSWSLGLGFAMPRSAWTPAADPTPDDGDGKETDGVPLTAVLIAFAALAGRRRTRT